MNSQGLAEDTVCALKQTKTLSFTNKEPIKNMNSQGLAEDTDARNWWSLFPPIKLSELTPDEQAERVNLFLFGFASIFLMNVMPLLIKVSVTFSEYEDQYEYEIKSNIRQIKGRCN